MEEFLEKELRICYWLLKYYRSINMHIYSFITNNNSLYQKPTQWTAFKWEKKNRMKLIIFLQHHVPKCFIPIIKQKFYYNLLYNICTFISACNIAERPLHKFL